MHSSYKLNSILSVDVPDGGIRVKPFDVLYFSQGNNVKVKDNGKLDITYTISGLPNTCTFNSETGELYADKNTDKSYNYSINIRLMSGTSLPPITGTIKLGYIEPAIGDFAYSDGTFSSVPNSDKTVVGVVFQKEVITAGEKWKLGILSNKTIKDYAGPAYYESSNSGKDWPESSAQRNVYNFMVDQYGIGIPSTDSYTGISNYPLQSPDAETVITYKTYSDKITDANYPKTMVDSGLSDTQILSGSGLERIRISAINNANFRSYLINKGFMNSQQALTNTWTEDNFDEIFAKYNEYANTHMHNSGTPYSYHMVTHPLAIRTSVFEPKNLSGKGLTYYAKGNWYIPSKSEIELLVWYRIISTITSEEASVKDTAAYWNDTTYSAGNSSLSIFSKINSIADSNFNFECLREWDLLTAKLAADNNNFIYEEHTYYSSSSITRYGWHYTYSSTPTWYQTAHVKCLRDKQYTIAPCCSIEVTKH